ncbi:MAG: hypothetical protein M2R46_03654 [Verrucomicrobia subdivision 3 bacterium]|nr:hypothetical protein [Limisphaerales bacterium]
MLPAMKPKTGRRASQSRITDTTSKVQNKAAFRKQYLKAFVYRKD